MEHYQNNPLQDLRAHSLPCKMERNKTFLNSSSHSKKNLALPSGATSLWSQEVEANTTN